MLPNKKPYQPCRNRLTELLIANITHRLWCRLCSRACLRASQELPTAGTDGYFFHFRRRLLVTTLTLLRAMAAPAIMGLSRKPFTG